MKNFHSLLNDLTRLLGILVFAIGFGAIIHLTLGKQLLITDLELQPNLSPGFGKQVNESLEDIPYPTPELDSIITPLPNNRTSFTGPDCLIDYLRKISINLPSGWYGDIGPVSINLYNYDNSMITYDHGVPQNLPDNHIKVEIYEFRFKLDQTIDEWVKDEKEQIKNSETEGLPSDVSENNPLKLGEYEGLIYTSTDSAGWNSRTIVINLSDETGLFIKIFPADSEALMEAIEVLTSINANISESPTCTTNSEEIAVQVATQEFAEDKDLREDYLFECPIGSFPGNEA